MHLPPAVSRLLAIRPEAVAFERLGFLCEATVRARLERMLLTFVDGYNLALAIDDDGQLLAATLRSRFDDQHVGAAFEGAGMCFGLRDLLAPWGASRLRAFVEGPAREHDQQTVSGAGFALARMPWGLRGWPAYARRLGARLAWCLPDGCGFYQGIFHARRYQDPRTEPPATLAAFARPPFDCGLGRSLWWSQGASPRRIAAAITAFPSARQRDLWCGVGVAAAYTGGVDDDALLDLCDLAGRNREDFLAGVPFAARMRQKGGNPWSGTDRACRLLLDRGADDAGDWLIEIVDGVLRDDGLDGEARRRDGYLLVRQRLVEELRVASEVPPPRKATLSTSA